MSIGISALIKFNVLKFCEELETIRNTVRSRHRLQRFKVYQQRPQSFSKRSDALLEDQCQRRKPPSYSEYYDGSLMSKINRGEKDTPRQSCSAVFYLFLLFALQCSFRLFLSFHIWYLCGIQQYQCQYLQEKAMNPSEEHEERAQIYSWVYEMPVLDQSTNDEEDHNDSPIIVLDSVENLKRQAQRLASKNRRLHDQNADLRRDIEIKISYIRHMDSNRSSVLKSQMRINEQNKILEKESQSLKKRVQDLEMKILRKNQEWQSNNHQLKLKNWELERYNQLLLKRNQRLESNNQQLQRKAKYLQMKNERSQKQKKTLQQYIQNHLFDKKIMTSQIQFLSKRNNQHTGLPLNQMPRQS